MTRSGFEKVCNWYFIRIVVFQCHVLAQLTENVKGGVCVMSHAVGTVTRLMRQEEPL